MIQDSTEGARIPAEGGGGEEGCPGRLGQLEVWLRPSTQFHLSMKQDLTMVDFFFLPLAVLIKLSPHPLVIGFFNLPYLLPRAAVTNYHNLGGLKPLKFTFSQF